MCKEDFMYAFTLVAVLVVLALTIFGDIQLMVFSYIGVFTLVFIAILALGKTCKTCYNKFCEFHKKYHNKCSNDSCRK